MIEKVVVEPYLLTAPAVPSSAEAKRWLIAFAAWIAEVPRREFSWLLWMKCLAHLAQEKLLVNFGILRAIAVAHKIDDIDVAQLSSAANSFFAEAASDCAAGCQVTEVIAENVVIDPLMIVARSAVREQLENDILCLAVENTDQYAIATADCDASTIFVRAKLLATEPASLAEGTSLDTYLTVMRSPRDLTLSMDALELLHRGQGSFCNHVCAKASQVGPVARVVIGPDFWASLEASEIKNDVAALTKLVRVATHVVGDTVEHINVQLRPIRTSSAGNAPQLHRKSDDATAWRLTLTNSGIGWRMHYWRKGTGNTLEIEFANVVKKGDPVHIPE